MPKRKISFVIALIAILILVILASTLFNEKSTADKNILYRNDRYGFIFALPETWRSFSIVPGKWQGYVPGSQGNISVETGPIVSIRHPKWTTQHQRQDIPIMIFTIAQWNSLQKDEFHIGAAPIGPKELGRNNKYVFALPARYNFAFPEGFEEVEKILENNPLQAHSVK